MALKCVVQNLLIRHGHSITTNLNELQKTEGCNYEAACEPTNLNLHYPSPSKSVKTINSKIFSVNLCTSLSH